MDCLQTCALSFEHLLDTQYHIIIGRKGKSAELNIAFAPTEFHHLAGLHKLRDLHFAKGNREKIFYKILEAEYSVTDLQKSQYFPVIEKRLLLLRHLEELLDGNQLIFRYNRRLQTHSLIEAEYLLSTPHKNTDVYIFLDYISKTESRFFCRSFFPKENKDYTQGQACYTLLKKEKTILSTGCTTIQYDRLTPKTTTP